MKLLSFLSALVKGVLKPDEVQVSQIKAIISDVQGEAQGKVPEAVYNKLKEEIYRFGASQHKLTELDKVLKDYSSQVIKTISG